MQLNSFGKLWPVSTLTLGGGGIGMVWGETTFDECVATVHAAVAAGINLIDVAPRYGDGKAEQVVGEAFAGRLPEGLRLTTKCNLGNPRSAEIEPLLRQSIEASLQRLRLSRLDLFFLHSNCRAGHAAHRSPARRRQPNDPLCDFCGARPAMLREAGRRGSDRRLGPDRDWPSGHDHQIARRAPRSGGGAVHCQSAGLAGMAAIL